MAERYLDVTKSVLISSPAGSGKTEKLAKRYIALLRNGSDVERILAITFTDKAAAEMKERILNIVRSEDPEMFRWLRGKMPRMRISTIHSFCLKLLKRFCFDLGIDPSLEVMDSFHADILWSEAIYESLVEEGLSGERSFYEVIRNRGIRGWNKLYAIFQEIHSRRPGIEMGIRGLSRTEIVCGVRGDSSGNDFEKVIALYSGCLGRYRRKKIERHVIDYDDLELMAYEAITKNPEWQNVLYSFDEHTDHILVDEFQDTSFLQWKILDKLTEEWRSGMGAKRESGIRPTLFLVGDDKQSIYSFRGAEVSIFRNARNRLSEWLGEEYHFEEIKENYRSLPAIVNFANALFEKLMPKGLLEDWRIEYAPFEATRKRSSGEDGSVELLLFDANGALRDARKGEASGLAQQMRALHGRHEIYADGIKRTCRYEDMAVLLRSRTHLAVFEDALRREGIPFIILKGIGFYNAPEVSIIKSMLFFLIDPLDDYSLFNILRSPAFALDYGEIFAVVREARERDASYGSLYSWLNSIVDKNADELPAQGALWEKDAEAASRKRLESVIAALNKWREWSRVASYSIVLENILSETGTWQYFHEKQRYLNIKKFIKLIEDFEAAGLTGLEIRENLIKASMRSDESKANVNTEGMDAVRLMTVHASKGLQFPMVFLPFLDEEHRLQDAGSVVTDEKDDRITIAYEEDAEARKSLPIFREKREKSLEEEKRLFYVGITRAMDYLCMSGAVRKGKYSGKLSYLSDAFGISPGFQGVEKEFFRVRKIEAEDVESPSITSRLGQPFPDSRANSSGDEIVFIEPIEREYVPSLMWRDVTEEIDSVRRKHGEDWVVLGRAFHKLFEGLSKATFTMETTGGRALDILRKDKMSEGAAAAMLEIIISDLRHLEGSGYLSEIILPRQNAYSELPFTLQRGNSVYRGRIDRLIVESNTVLLYDYKTYPVSEAEIPELIERYSFQMKVYREAAEQLFSLRTRSFLFFTHEARIIEI